MKELKEKILEQGIALNHDILKVDSFLNHQVDPILMRKIGEDFAKHFANRNITKIVTVESSGIAPSLMCAEIMNVPLIILKKQSSKILNNDIYSTDVTSFTKGITYPLTLSKKYISSDDNVLFIDDFLANGEAASGAIRLIQMANAHIAGIGIVIEKSFQPGRSKLEEKGFEVYSLARISKLDKDYIEFV